MNVLIVEPGVIPYEKRIGSSSDMQSIVEGEIREIQLFGEQTAIVCNADGRSLKLPFNRSVPGEPIGVFGTFLICRLSRKGFCSLTREQIKRYRTQFYQAELFLRMDGSKAVTLLLPPRRKTQSTQEKKRGGYESR